MKVGEIDGPQHRTAPWWRLEFVAEESERESTDAKHE